MTPEEFACLLPFLAHGPHDDATMVALARIIAESVRVLNHATRRSYAMSDPATMCTVLGELAAAVNRFPQLGEQLARAVIVQGQNGHLGHTGSLDAALASLRDELGTNVVRHAADLGGDFSRAHQTASGLYRPALGGTGQ